MQVIKLFCCPAGATALLATASALFKRMGGPERRRSRSRHRRSRSSRLRDSRLMLVDTVESPPLIHGDPPPPYSLWPFIGFCFVMYSHAVRSWLSISSLENFSASSEIILTPLRWVYHIRVANISFLLWHNEHFKIVRRQTIFSQWRANTNFFPATASWPVSQNNFSQLSWNENHGRVVFKTDKTRFVVTKNCFYLDWLKRVFVVDVATSLCIFERIVRLNLWRTRLIWMFDFQKRWWTWYSY